MRDLTTLEQYRDRRAEREHYGENGDATVGMFRLWLTRRDGNQGGKLRVIATSGQGWDHVSVSHRTRCPTWEEMEEVKRMFFEDHETAMQLHVPPSDHISCHPFCLHLWRPHDVEIPRPPSIMVGLRPDELLVVV